MKVEDLKRGELFILNGEVYRRVFIDGYIKTMKGHTGLDCILATNDFMLIFIAVGNIVQPFN